MRIFVTRRWRRWWVVHLSFILNTRDRDARHGTGNNCDEFVCAAQQGDGPEYFMNPLQVLNTSNNNGVIFFIIGFGASYTVCTVNLLYV